MSGWSSLDGRSSTGSAAEVDLEEFSDEPFERALEDLYEKRSVVLGWMARLKEEGNTSLERVFFECGSDCGVVCLNKLDSRQHPGS